MNIHSSMLFIVRVMFITIVLTSCDSNTQSKPSSDPDANLISISKLNSKSKNPSVNKNFQATGLIAQSLPEISEALSDGLISSEQLVQLYLERIKLIDQQGPTLRTVLTINPDALALAQEYDKLRKQGEVLGPLHGVPILLKDNIETKDPMPTTAGSLALKDNFTSRDSPLVTGLRAQGAIILGKANLSQWANFRSENSMSGWTALGGQVKNPHMLDRNPCGSSSGSAAAAAASLAAGTVGTETNGSIICPANANGVVGFKPTVGVISQQYIIPISASQDTAGPITKTVKGAAMLMNAMATSTVKIDYTSELDINALKGVRIGVLSFAKGNSSPINNLFEVALRDLEKAGAILVDIDQRPETPEHYSKYSYDLLKYEFKQGINDYLESTSPQQVTTRNLTQLIEFNQQNAETELALFDQSIFVASNKMGPLEEQYQVARDLVLETSKLAIDNLLADNNLSVLIAPSGPLVPRVDPINGDVWPNNWPGFGSYAARAGYPHATVPMGGFKSLPIGLSFIGGKNNDAKILGFAFAYEQQSKRRLLPSYLKDAEAVDQIARAMRSTKHD